MFLFILWDLLQTLLPPKKRSMYLPPLRGFRVAPPKPKSPKSFEKFSIVDDLLDWVEGKKSLHTLTASSVGLDAWLYELRGKKIPTFEQTQLLKGRIWQLAHDSPLRLVSALENYQLIEILGEGEFGWLELPQPW